MSSYCFVEDRLDFSTAGEQGRKERSIVCQYCRSQQTQDCEGKWSWRKCTNNAKDVAVKTWHVWVLLVCPFKDFLPFPPWTQTEVIPDMFRQPHYARLTSFRRLAGLQLATAITACHGYIAASGQYSNHSSHMARPSLPRFCSSFWAKFNFLFAKKTSVSWNTWKMFSWNTDQRRGLADMRKAMPLCILELFGVKKLQVNGSKNVMIFWTITIHNSWETDSRTCYFHADLSGWLNPWVGWKHNPCLTVKYFRLIDSVQGFEVSVSQTN